MRPGPRFFGAIRPRRSSRFCWSRDSAAKRRRGWSASCFGSAATVRANGIKKILTGIGLMAVPVVALIIFLMIGVIPLKIFAVTIMIGLWGVWTLINGIIMVLAPKAEHGDLADQ